MKGNYKSYFLIPSDAIRSLGDCGWEFQSKKRIPRKLANFFMLGLNLSSSAEDNDMERFAGRNAEAVFFLDESGDIEHIYLRTYGDRDIGIELRHLLNPDSLDFEVFDPRKAVTKSSEPPKT